MIEDVRTRFHHHFQGVVLAIEVGNENLDRDGGHGFAHGFDRARKVLGTTVGDVVTRDGGDDDVIEAHAFGGFGHALRLVRLQREGFGRFDGAEAAGARAAVTGNHEGGGALAPALPAVWALRLLTHRVQFEIGDHPLRAPKLGITRKRDANPIRLLFAMEGGINLGSHAFTEESE